MWLSDSVVLANLIRPYSALPNMRIRNFSLRHSEPNGTKCGAERSRTCVRSEEPKPMLPALTPEAHKAAAAEREFRLALLQATETCKSDRPQCQGGKYDPTPSPRRAEL